MTEKKSRELKQACSKWSNTPVKESEQTPLCSPLAQLLSLVHYKRLTAMFIITTLFITISSPNLIIYPHWYSGLSINYNHSFNCADLHFVPAALLSWGEHTRLSPTSELEQDNSAVCHSFLTVKHRKIVGCHFATVQLLFSNGFLGSHPKATNADKHRTKSLPFIYLELLMTTMSQQGRNYNFNCSYSSCI